MKRLKGYAALGALFMLAACVSGGGPSYFDKTAYQSDSSTVAKKYLKMEGDPQKVTKVFIPMFRVDFQTKSSASAESYNFGASSGAKARVFYHLKGLEQKEMIALTEQFYDDVVAELKSQGIEVIPASRWKNLAAYTENIKEYRKPNPYVTEDGTYVAPKGQDVYFDWGHPEANVCFSPCIPEQDVDGAVSVALGNVPALRVKVWVGFASVETKERSDSAAVTGRMRFTLGAGGTSLKLNGEYSVAHNSFTGNDNYFVEEYADYKLQKPLISSQSIEKEVKDSTSAGYEAANTLSSMFSALAGTSTSSTTEYDMFVNNDAYMTTAREHLKYMAQMFGQRLKDS